MIYDAIINRCYEVGQGRFGARSVRTCLDSPHTTRYQKVRDSTEILLTRSQKRIASAIILNALPLATNANGAILLTWLLETSELPGRYRLLAPRLAPHLNHLCTHKLASSTLIRVVNQSTDPAAVRADASWRALTITGSADPGRPVRERADARGHPERLGACTDPIDLSSRPRTTAWASLPKS